jgi:VIT1/CCC1 family predicted Fe2+/Mn2+ transporter
MSGLESWSEEKQSGWLYRELAKAERDPHVSALFAKLALEADSQAIQWEKTLAANAQALPAFSPSLRARLVIAIARRIGPRRMRGALAAIKVRGLSAYSAAPVSGHAMPTSVEEIGRGHRSVGGGNLRAAIFGINDGLVSNASLILGVVGANVANAAVLTTGIAGMLAGAMAMAAGEFVSVSSQREMYEYQISLEADELKEYPEAEAEELALIYEARGLPLDEARRMAHTLISNPAHALDALAREELGLNPQELGSPTGAAVFSFVSFAIGALVPMLPFFVGARLPDAAWIGALLAALGLFATGAAMSLFTGRRAVRSGLRMLLIGGGAGAVTYAIGHVIGAGIG